jgi:hypothetical protein
MFIGRVEREGFDPCAMSRQRVEPGAPARDREDFNALIVQGRRYGLPEAAARANDNRFAVRELHRSAS